MGAVWEAKTFVVSSLVQSIRLHAVVASVPYTVWKEQDDEKPNSNCTELPLHFICQTAAQERKNVAREREKVGKGKNVTNWICNSV